MKIDELTPRCPSVNMTVKILSLEEPREVGEGKTVRESLIGDETGTVVMSFWGEECNEVNQDDVLSIEKGRVSLVGGSLRVSLGRDGSMNIVEDGPENIRKDLNMSDIAYAPPKTFGGGRRGGGHRGGGRRGGGHRGGDRRGGFQKNKGRRGGRSYS
tara:strand:+ start:4927 stop:5397 length:471 start_codon:yes stop_codon:yes gene_type:complete